MKELINKEILEGNKLIAEFMGWKVVTGPEIGWPGKDHFYGINPQTKRTRNCLNNKDLQKVWEKISKNVKYHKSWDWLIPVVEKIYKVYDAKYIFSMRIEITSTHVGIFSDHFTYLKTAIDKNFKKFNTIEVWEACIKFIKWYNQKALKLIKN